MKNSEQAELWAGELEKSDRSIRRQSAPLDFESLAPEQTALLVVDMINGFAKSGSLSSGRVGALIPSVAELTGRCREKGFKMIFFADSHPEDSPEFQFYPSHCIRGTRESEIVDELKGQGRVIEKNSTNAFLEPEFQTFLKDNSEIRNFLIAGCCTDICVLQLALTLKTHFNRLDERSRIIVPRGAVDTYDAPAHPAELWNLFSFGCMLANGIELAESLTPRDINNGGIRK
ncbi:MAG TPA: isochorismatase family cysteine hydrolase [Clostridia bacterium]|nr:isochorismatase family cysteine hydrolase [Clostridia bacterium]